MSYELVENPAYAGRTPTPQKAVCHDGSPFVSVKCACGYVQHLHETQLAAIPEDAEVGSPCKGCGELHVYPPGFFEYAFQQMRLAGWIE